METDCKALKRKLKSLVNQGIFDKGISMRMLSLANMVSRISDTMTKTIWMQDTLNDCQAFMDKIVQTTYFRIQINQDLSQIEEKVLSLLVAQLDIPPLDVQPLINEANSQLRNFCTLDSLLPKFLDLYLKKVIFKNDEIFKGDAEPQFQNLFKTFKIPFNEFAIKLAESIMCGRNQYNYSVGRLEDFLSLFFGSNENYKFYVKTARILEDIKCKNILPVGSPFRYTITLSSFNTNYKGNNRITMEEEVFECSGLAHNRDSCRNDGILLIGRHPNADIVFPPDDYSVELLSCIIINSNDGIYIVDASKASKPLAPLKYSYCSIKLNHQKKYKFLKGQLINLGKRFTFHVEDIKMEDDNIEPKNQGTVTFSYEFDEVPKNSNIKLKCIEGLYKDENYTITTKTRNPQELKLIHIFGTGGNGIAPDFFFPSGYGVSRDHFRLEYDTNKNYWNIIDYKSTKGTYLLLKNYEQLTRRVHSGCIKLFKKNICGERNIFTVGNYFFMAIIAKS